MPWPRGKNLQAELVILLKKPIETIPIVVGVSGEHIPQTRKNLRKLGFNTKDCDKIIANLGRSAVLGTCLVLRAHLAKTPSGNIDS